MGPGRRRYWLPFVRLGAFFAGVVVGVNLLLHLLAPSSAPANREGARKGDFFDRKKRKLERHLRSFELFFDGFRGRESGSAGRTEEIAWSYAQDVEPLAVEVPVAVALAAPEPAAPRFLWPDVPPPLPRLEYALLEPMVTPEIVADWYRLAAPDPVADVGDALLRGPEFLLDGLFGLAAGIAPRPPESGDEGGILPRLLDFRTDPRRGRLFSEFTEQWLDRERRYFSRFEDSRVSSVGFEAGTEDADLDELMDDQRKILWDALRKTYFSKYRFRAEERLREDAFYFNEWRGMDFAVLPPLMAGYLWFRGLEKRFSVSGTSLRVAIEPLSRWADGRDDLVGGAGVEWAPTKNFPVCLIVTTGLYDGRAELDFIGIGTSLGMARKTVALQRQGDDRD
jgi:hypothetical protein